MNSWGRGWLSLAYVLASLLAQGVHDHDRGAEAAVPESRGGCDNSGPHVGDHEVGEHGAAPTVCPSCQFRGQPSLWSPGPRPLPRVGRAAPPAIDPPSTLPGSPLRARCRAPPGRD